MSGHQPFENLTRMCESCRMVMPVWSVRAFVDDEATKFVCKNEQACETRRAGQASKPLLLTEEMEDAYKRATGVNWSRLNINHRAGLQAVLDVVAKQGPWADRAGTPTGYNLHLLHLSERVRLLEAWRHAIELGVDKPRPKRPGLNWDAAGEDDPA
jgi:hypothetical protein